MSDLSNLSASSLSLALTAHRRAQSFQRYHSAPAVQKRVYLNTLATYAVATYLEMRGYDIDLDHSYSQDPAQQTLMDVADIVVDGVGRLECRPVLPGDTAVTVPAAVSCDRAAYLAIQLDESLRQATLLGFFVAVPDPTHSLTLIPLATLRSPDELGPFLEQLAAGALPVRLRRWLQQTAETGWQVISEAAAELTTPTPTFVFRSAADITDTTAVPQPLPTIGQSKPITLGSDADAVTVILLVGLIPQPQTDLEVWVQVSPAPEQTHLPAALRLAILDEAHTPVMQAEARDTKAIQLKFTAAIAERFSVQITLGDRTFTQPFEG